MGLFSSKPDYSKLRTRKNQSEAPAPKPWVKWVKMGVALALYLLFLLWVKSWWGLLVVPFIYDAYITKKIKWGWWRELDNPARAIMSWVDASVFALIAVYFVHNFFFQNYKIPSSSLEKTLLTGDYLLVSKLSYGPRIPMTPLTMPLTNHTLPLTGTKSYLDWPRWDYRRVKGFGPVELGDIVVFNYPAGDTVATAYNYDFYDLCEAYGEQIAMQSGEEVLTSAAGLSTEEQMKRFYHYYGLGRKYVESDPRQFGKVVVRPVDRRENYVKRCVGLPGQTLQIKNKVIYLDGKAQPQPEKAQFNYYIYTKDGQMLSDALCAQLGISDEDRAHEHDRPELPGQNNGMPLTQAALKVLKAQTSLIDSIVAVTDGEFGHLYPLDHDYGWTRDNYGPVYIPKKGDCIDLTLDNIAIYERPIRAYEGNDLRVSGGKIYINGKVAKDYTFKMDYYWMMGDNRHNSADSRYWGFVPEDHIVGKPLVVWLSVSPDRNPESSGYRWNRLLKWVSGIR